ncbi:MAG: hypothetical protein ABEK50_06205 [bacterium]
MGTSETSRGDRANSAATGSAPLLFQWLFPYDDRQAGHKFHQKAFGRVNQAIDLVSLLALLGCNAAVYYGFKTLMNFFRRYTAWRVYDSPSFILSSLSYPSFLLTVGTMLTGFLLLWTKTRWDEFETPNRLRVLIVPICLLLAGYLGLSEYNFFWDQGFLFDRFLLIGFALAVFYHPFFLVPALVVLIGFYAQVNLPFGRYHTPYFLPLLEVLLLFVSYMILRGIRKVPLRVFLYGLLCLIGASYFAPGFHKILASPNGLEWVLEYRLDYGAEQSYFLGWWWWNENLFWSLMAFLREYQRPMIGLTLLLELSAPLIFLGFYWTLIIMSGFLVFHLVTFTMAGFLFWKLGLALILLLLVLWSLPPKTKWFLYHSTVRYVAIGIVVLTPVTGVFETHRLVWWDTKHQVRFDLMARTNEGTVRLSYPSLGPYSESFGRGLITFNRMIDRPIILSQSTTARRARIINNELGGLVDLRELENRIGRTFYSSTHSAQIKLFLRRYFRNYRERTEFQEQIDSWLRFLRFPRYVNHTGGPNYTNIRDLDAKLRGLEVRRVEGVSRKDRVEILRNRLTWAVDFTNHNS